MGDKLRYLVIASILICGTLAPSKTFAVDFGDAPAPYPQAEHEVTSYQWLGAGVSNDPQPRFPDTYDDGVFWSAQDVVPGGTFELTFIATSDYETDVITAIWIDLDQDGTWSDPTERVVNWTGTVTQAPVGFSRLVTHTISVPATAVPGETWLRARLNWASSQSAAEMSPTSYQAFGECEDYAITIVPEPATLSLTVLALLTISRRRR